MRNVALLGSTGHIGTATLDVVAAHPDRLKIVAMAAGRNRELFRLQCEQFRPGLVSVLMAEDATWLSSVLSYQPTIFYGMDGLIACALKSESNTVVAAVVGVAGLASIEAALLSGQRVCVANKESLVVGGAVLRQALDSGGGELLPIDSEHCALHQLLADRVLANVREVRITASGGPFLDWTLSNIMCATVQQALKHPTWKMGNKITIDSATLMNKGLEVIEAATLFNLCADQIQVTVHPQSQVHAMVGFRDGTYHLQACVNDMKLPIQYALLYPECVLGSVPVYDWDSPNMWTFRAPDLLRFPCLSLAYSALRAGGTAPTTLNAANDEAVSAFMSGEISFWQIQACVAETLSVVPVVSTHNLEQIMDVDRSSRVIARDWIYKHQV
jgi:1-deoxy-D-xylulose-5-phosphate reductoisomerase